MIDNWFLCERREVLLLNVIGFGLWLVLSGLEEGLLLCLLLTGRRLEAAGRCLSLNVVGQFALDVVDLIAVLDQVEGNCLRLVYLWLLLDLDVASKGVFVVRRWRS